MLERWTSGDIPRAVILGTGVAFLAAAIQAAILARSNGQPLPAPLVIAVFAIGGALLGAAFGGFSAVTFRTLLGVPVLAVLGFVVGLRRGREAVRSARAPEPPPQPDPPQPLSSPG